MNSYLTRVSDVVAVVSHWFGGTLLGAGGLVRAYGDAVRLALGSAGTMRRDLVTEFAIHLDHGSAGRVESELRARGLVVLDAAYGDRVTLVVGSPAPETVGPLVAEVTAGAAVPERVGECWVGAR